MKTYLASVLTVVVLLAAGVLAVVGTLAGIRHFTHSEDRTAEVLQPAPRVEPLSIVMAKYSCGSQSADVTQRVRELIAQDHAVWANPGCLHADPHPYLNKALVIVYTVEGKSAMLSVGENEKVDRERLVQHAKQDLGKIVAQMRSSR